MKIQHITIYYPSKQPHIKTQLFIVQGGSSNTRSITLSYIVGGNNTSRFNILSYVVQGGEGGGKDHGGGSSFHKGRNNTNFYKILFHEYQGLRTKNHNLVVLG